MAGEDQAAAGDPAAGAAGDLAARLCVLSHGRQGAYALFCHLNAHPRLFLPDFAYTDGLLLEDRPYAPEGPYSGQLRIPRMVEGLQVGILVHLFSHLHLLPGPLPGRLARRLAPEPVVVLVPREPVANLRSMHRTYLELFHGRRHFGLELPGHPLYDRERPLALDEYVALARFGVDYGAQLEHLAPAGSRLLLFDFAELGPRGMGEVLATIAGALDLDPEPVRGLGREATNAGGDLVHQRLFSFRSRVEVDGQRVDLGFFDRASDPLVRGSFELELADIELEDAGGVAAFASTGSWFLLPPRTRRWLAQGEGRELVHAQWARYRAYREGIAARVAEDLAPDPMAVAGGVIEREVLPAARAFRERWPEATGSWGP